MAAKHWPHAFKIICCSVALAMAAEAWRGAAPAAAQTANREQAVDAAPKPAIRRADKVSDDGQSVAGLPATEVEGDWRNERFEAFGDWVLSCEVAVAEQPSPNPPRRRCYLQNAQTYQPPPDFRSAALFLLSTPDGYSVQLSLEPGAFIADTELSILRRPVGQVAAELQQGGDVAVSAPPEQTPQSLILEEERLFSLSECESHFCDLGRIKSTFLLTRMYAEPTGALLWRMRPFNGDRPEIRFDLGDFAIAAKAFAAADPDAARAYEEFIK